MRISAFYCLLKVSKIAKNKNKKETKRNRKGKDNCITKLCNEQQAVCAEMKCKICPWTKKRMELLYQDKPMKLQERKKGLVRHYNCVHGLMNLELISLANPFVYVYISFCFEIQITDTILL